MSVVESPDGAVVVGRLRSESLDDVVVEGLQSVVESLDGIVVEGM